MTTQELYELTRGHEGRPYWPDDCQWAAGGTAYDMWIGDEMTDNTSQIEALFIGSAVKWLVENNYYHIFLRKYAADQYVASMTLSNMNHERTSLLAAVLAACEAAYKAGGGT